MNRAERKFLANQVKIIPADSIVVEIGSWTGGSAETMAKVMEKRDFKHPIHCIDPWRYERDNCHPSLYKLAEGRNIFKEFVLRMKDYDYRAHVGENEDFLDSFKNNSIGLLFLDGDHSYEGVKADILNWRPKIKMGGIICGHDYNNKYGVKKAVDEIFGDRVENPARSMWRVFNS